MHNFRLREIVVWMYIFFSDDPFVVSFNAISYLLMCKFLIRPILCAYMSNLSRLFTLKILLCSGKWLKSFEECALDFLHPVVLCCCCLGDFVIFFFKRKIGAVRKIRQCESVLDKIITSLSSLENISWLCCLIIIIFMILAISPSLEVVLSSAFGFCHVLRLTQTLIVFNTHFYVLFWQETKQEKNCRRLCEDVADDGEKNLWNVIIKMEKTSIMHAFLLLQGKL